LRRGDRQRGGKKNIKRREGQSVGEKDGEEKRRTC